MQLRVCAGTEADAKAEGSADGAEWRGASSLPRASDSTEHPLNVYLGKLSTTNTSLQLLPPAHHRSPPSSDPSRLAPFPGPRLLHCLYFDRDCPPRVPATQPSRCLSMARPRAGTSTWASTSNPPHDDFASSPESPQAGVGPCHQHPQGDEHRRDRSEAYAPPRNHADEAHSAQGSTSGPQSCTHGTTRTPAPFGRA